MKGKIALALYILIIWTSTLQAKLLINEITITSASDWVELFYASDQREKMDISKLYVTMYYGTNEPLAESPVTIYSYDRPETPWDDRFVVVHLTEPGKVDETDLTGDSNHNGYIDIYCNNYNGSLWNTEGVVAIDTDDDPANGGIIDFIAYSNRDGSANTTITSCINYAQSFAAWQTCSGDPQLCAFDITSEGLQPFMSIIRKSRTDTNSADDFAITKFQTPGKENIQSVTQKNKRLFKLMQQTLTVLPGHVNCGKNEILILLYENCNLTFRIHSSIGRNLYSSPLYQSQAPGYMTLAWHTRKQLSTGLYLGRIEAYDTRSKKSQTEIMYIIVSHYK